MTASQTSVKFDVPEEGDPTPVEDSSNEIEITVTMNQEVEEDTELTLTCEGDAGTCPTGPVVVAASSSSATFNVTISGIGNVVVKVSYGDVEKEITLKGVDAAAASNYDHEIIETFEGSHTRAASCQGETSYCEGTFTSTATNLTWSYVGGRTNLDNYAIEGAALIFKIGSLETTIPTGIGSISLQAKQAFSGSASDRKIKISVNGTVCLEETALTSSEAEEFKCENLDVSENAVLKIESTADKQVLIDNVKIMTRSEQ